MEFPFARNLGRQVGSLSRGRACVERVEGETLQLLFSGQQKKTHHFPKSLHHDLQQHQRLFASQVTRTICLFYFLPAEVMPTPGTHHRSNHISHLTWLSPFQPLEHHAVTQGSGNHPAPPFPDPSLNPVNDCYKRTRDCRIVGIQS